MRLAQHSANTNEHYTPLGLLDAARDVFGGEIDTDPASCAEANKLVRARRYYTKEENGFLFPWEGNVWLNPPGGRDPEGSQAAHWWAALASRFEHTNTIKQACFLCFNLELLRHAQAWSASQPTDYSVCIFRHRLKYWKFIDGKPVLGTSPSHASALVYLGDRWERFKEVFSGNGEYQGLVLTR